MIEVYSDFLCPWCYIGSTRLLKGLRALPGDRQLQVRWRSFQLAPDASSIPGKSASEAMHEWYASTGEAAARIGRIETIGRADGLEINLKRARPVNTFDAHRLSHLAMSSGAADLFNERIFFAYHTKGSNIADPDVLLRIATTAGLNEGEVEATLGSDRFADAVRADQELAKRHGATGVPKIAVGGGTPQSLIQEHSALVALLADAQAILPADAGEHS